MEEIEYANILATAVWQCRNLIHTPANIKNPVWLAKQATEMVSAAKTSDLSISIKSGRAIKEFGGLVAVGNSAPNPGPRLIEVTYAPKGSSNWPHVVLVGKGITFDTGGYALKPKAGMEAMKSDMSGAAAVSAAVLAIAELKLPIAIDVWAAMAENMISDNATRPSDIHTMYGGKTIEVLNTDAEGRLILADAIYYIDEQYKPELIVDLATLTGAIVVSLGSEYAGLFSNNDILSEKLIKAGEIENEKLWRFPLQKNYDKLMDSKVADMQNINYSGGAGSITAAQFLQRFVLNKTPWAHLDIAGMAFSKYGGALNSGGATGYGVRLLNKLIEDDYE